MVISSGRDRVFDSLRGLAVVLMVWQHTGLYLLTDLTQFYYGYAVLASRLSAPIFLVLAGYFVGSSASRRISVGGRLFFFKRIMYRVFELCVLGLVVNLLRFDGLLYINILHLIAFGILFCALVYLSGSRVVYFIALASCFVYLFSGAGYPFEVMVSSPQSVLVWFFASGEFPIASWVIYSLIGLGVFWFGGGVRVDRVFAGEALIITGLLSSLVLDYGSIAVNCVPFMLVVSGFMFLAYQLMLWSRISNPVFSGFLAAFGRHALGVYVWHLFVFSALTQLLGVSNLLSWPGAALVYLASLFAAYLFVIWFESVR